MASYAAEAQPEVVFVDGFYVDDVLWLANYRAQAWFTADPSPDLNTGGGATYPAVPIGGRLLILQDGKYRAITP